jgi:hypothetical protein
MEVAVFDCLDNVKFPTGRRRLQYGLRGLQFEQPPYGVTDTPPPRGKAVCHEHGDPRDDRRLKGVGNVHSFMIPLCPAKDEPGPVVPEQICGNGPRRLGVAAALRCGAFFGNQSGRGNPTEVFTAAHRRARR